MASSSLSHQQQKAFSGIEPPKERRKVDESSRVFDVFINHRGPDVKQTLATQFYNSLKELNIKAFLDSEEKELGVSFPSIIETAIRSASVHIAIFSKTYAESAWCLAELVLMLQSKAKIIPVFYQVEPWELRRIEKGKYANAFTKYETEKRYLDKLKKWKEALQQVSYTAGYELKNSDECKTIVSAVEKEVQRTKPIHVAKYPVGLPMLVEDFERRCLDELVQDFESHCGMEKVAKEKANVVAIFGMGGVGKTTLSKELFNRKRSKYRRASFLFDVRETSANGKLPSLQSKLLSDIFGEGNKSFLSSEEGKNCLRDHLERRISMSFLIVLDDIDHVEQLDALLPMDILDKHGDHLVIITTRDVGVLAAAGIDRSYHLQGFGKKDGTELFCWHAFEQPLPFHGYEDLVQDFVNMCAGLPLSLIVLGRHVSRRPQWYWQDELEKARKALPGDVKKRLKISFDALDNEEQQIFMDIACFFLEKSITTAVAVWEGYGWKARHALQTLKEKCLVEEVQIRYLSGREVQWESSADRSALRMHDHLRDLGRQMANELSHPRRVWHPQHLKSLESKGFGNILAQTNGRCFCSIFDESMGCRITYFLGEPEDGSDTSSLRWLQLDYMSSHNIHLNSGINSGIPSWIPLQHLQCLRISHGLFQELWQNDVQAPSHLKELQIHLTSLEEFPDLSENPDLCKLVELKIRECVQLEELRLAHLSCVEKIAIQNCNHLKSVSGISNLAKLVELKISGCHMLDLQELRLEHLSCLEKIAIEGCNQLKSVSGISNLRKLVELEICMCERLEFEYLCFCDMKCLERITIDRCVKMKYLELDGCKKLKTIKFGCKDIVNLSIRYCAELENLSDLVGPSCLRRIIIEGCGNLKMVLNGLENLESVSGNLELRQLDIIECPELNELPSIAQMSCLKIYSCEKLQNITLPTTLIELDVQSCRHLQKAAVDGDLTKLRQMTIKQCPVLEEELPSLARVRCLEEIVIDSCEKLQNITLPTTLIMLDVQSCRDLQKVVAVGDLRNLKQLIIRQCPVLEELQYPVLEELLSPSRLRYLKEMKIDSCEKLQIITLPTTLIMLDVQICRDLQKIVAVGNLKILKQLIIRQCPVLEELPSPSRLSYLKEMKIDSCEKLQIITLPTTLIMLDVQICRDLLKIAAVGNLKTLKQLIIRQCPVLEELPSPSRLSYLKEMKIDSCEKLQIITLPTTLIMLDVQICRDLQKIVAVGNLKILKQLIIRQCPVLEELPSPSRLSYLKEMKIDSCEKLQIITLPTTLIMLDVQICRDLQKVVAVGDLRNLKQLIIRQCPVLEELPSPSRLNYLKEMKIVSCEKLQIITLPTTLNKLDVQSCRDLPKIVGVGDLENLKQLIIRQCPVLEELPSPSRLSYLKEMKIDSCEKLQIITLPTTLNKLDVQSCRDLQKIVVVGDLENLKQLIIRQCPVLEELPSPSRLSYLKETKIDSCVKLQIITLPTTLNKLDVQSCRDLQKIVAVGDLENLKQLIIRQCPVLEELPSPSRMSYLEEMEIYSFEKLQIITLPTTLNKLDVQSCRDLQKIVAVGDLKNLKQLIIRQCPVLEELPSPSRLSYLEEMKIYSCGKLQIITLSTILIKLYAQSCRDLQKVVAVGNRRNLKQLIIRQCPVLEELPNPYSLSYLKEIKIDSCEKLKIIKLPTTLIRLDVQSCRDLQKVAAVGDLRNLEQLIIRQCPALEELPSPYRLSYLKEIKIDYCEKLKIIMLPTTLIRLDIQSCRDLQKGAAVRDLRHLKQFIIRQCPALKELPSLARVSFLEEIVIESCEKLQKIAVMEELQALEFLTLIYCSKALIRSCIHELKIVPSFSTVLIGRAVDGAESSLNKNLFRDASIGDEGVIEISSRETYPEWSEFSFVIGCYMVVVDSSASVQDINYSLQNYVYPNNFCSITVREGEWIITIGDCSCFQEIEDILRRHRIMKKGFRVEVKKGEEWKSVGVFRTIVDRLHL